MKLTWVSAAAALALFAGAHGAQAQIARSPILDKGSAEAMRGEVEQRYQAALTATRSREIIAANDVRYTWASEAKVACGIALGFLKTSTVDEDSINKCDDYSRRMSEARPVVAAAPPPAAPAPAPCAVQLPLIFYFEWNSDQAPAEAANVAATAAQQMKACGWTGLKVSGYADSSGAPNYNQALSERRARNVADLLHANGIAAETISVEAFGETKLAVQTGDGVREPLNRRVEVNATAAQ